MRVFKIGSSFKKPSDNRKSNGKEQDECAATIKEPFAEMLLTKEKKSGRFGHSS